MSDEAVRFEQTTSPWLRYGLPALAGACIVAVVVTGFLDHQWWQLSTAAALLLSGSGAWLNMWTRTLVTRDRIIIQHGFRRRIIPTSQVEAVTQRTSWSPVQVRLVSGETIVLPKVANHDRETITRLIRQDARSILVLRGDEPE